MTKTTRHATREALAILTRQKAHQDEIDVILAAIPTHESRDRKAVRRQQQRETR